MTFSVPAADVPILHVSQRQLMRRSATVGLLMRNCVNVVVVLVALADPHSQARPAGIVLLVALGAWSSYRIATRSHDGRFIAVDYAFALAICLAIPLLTADPHFYAINSAPQAIAGTAVISVSIAVSVRTSLLLTLGIAGAYAWGAAAVMGWQDVGAVAALYYFAVQWVTSALLVRFMLSRVAAVVDRARSDRHDAEVRQQITDAVRDHEREQLALLHDTAASTLLVVGQGTSLPPHRLSAQARRDLDLLDGGPWVAPPARIELVAALRDCSTHLSTPVCFEGRTEVWLDGDTAKSVIAAAREAMTNVDRHADAGRLVVTVSADAVTLADDGRGFDPLDRRTGHGVSESIIGRMARAGGHANIGSAPGSGTVIELAWAASSMTPDPDAPGDDPDRLIDRVRARYGLALTAYALVNLAFSTSYLLMTGATVTVDAALATVAGISTLAAIPGLTANRWGSARIAGVALAVVMVVQPALLPDDLLGGYAHWTQNAIGWCVLPLVLGLSTRRGAAILAAYWFAGAAVELIRHPTAELLVNVGLGTGSILGVQLFALAFGGLMRDAAADAHLETQARQRLISRDRVEYALRADYRRRYATLVGNVVPILETLSRGGTVDDALQRRARAECRRLRALFDQATTFDHPLMQRLRPLVDGAEERQVDVVIDVTGHLPDLTADEIDAVVRPSAVVLDVAETTARLVLTSTADELSVSIVCDGTAPESTARSELSDEVDDFEIVTSEDMVWCLIRRPRGALAAGARQ
jgi:hypothetical protein